MRRGEGGGLASKRRDSRKVVLFISLSLTAAAVKASTPTRTPAHTPTPSVKEGGVAVAIEEGGETKAEAEGALDVSDQCVVCV